MMTAVDLVIIDLADGNADLRQRVAHLEADVVSYRELAQVAIATVADLTVKCNRLRVELRQLRDEYRALRSHALREAA